MFYISSKAQNQADKFLADQQAGHIKNSVFVDRETIEFEKREKRLSQLQSIFDMKLLSAKYFKGTFTEFVKFYESARCCSGCERQFKPKYTAEQIYSNYIKAKSQTHYRSQN